MSRHLNKNHTGTSLWPPGHTFGIQVFGKGARDGQVGYGKWLQVGVMEAAGCLESGNMEYNWEPELRGVFSGDMPAPGIKLPLW